MDFCNSFLPDFPAFILCVEFCLLTTWLSLGLFPDFPSGCVSLRVGQERNLDGNREMEVWIDKEVPGCPSLSSLSFPWWPSYLPDHCTCWLAVASGPPSDPWLWIHRAMIPKDTALLRPPGGLSRTLLAKLTVLGFSDLLASSVLSTGVSAVWEMVNDSSVLKLSVLDLFFYSSHSCISSTSYRNVLAPMTLRVALVSQVKPQLKQRYTVGSSVVFPREESL